MEYHNLQTENNYNYPIFNADNNFNAKKPNNCYNIPLQIQDKNDLKESLLSKDNYIEEYKQSSFNYIHPKQTGEYNIKDIQFYDNKCNNFVESKENQINLINNDINQQLPKKTYISSNYVIKNEISSLEGANNIPAQQSFQLNQDSNQHQSIPIVNYSFNNNQNKSISQNNNYNQNINYNPCFNNTNYKPVGSSMNSVNYQIPTPSNYSFQPQSILNNNNKINSNVVSYSFNNPNSDVTNISEDNSINNVNPKAKIDQASKNDQNTKPVIPNYQQIDCSKCKTRLAYPPGSKGVFCPLCQTVTSVVKMEYIMCGRCKVTLTFPSGAQYIKCQACKIVNINPYLVKKN